MSSASPAAIDPKDFYIHHQKGATIVRLPGSINGLDLMIEDLDDCTVYILDHSAQITVDYCNNTRFVIGPVDGPFFIRNCKNCTVQVAWSVAMLLD
jgi:protein XRP2